MYIDSHCHIDFPDLAPRIGEVIHNMANNQVTHALCVCVNLEDWPRVKAVAETYDNIYASVGVHPDHVEGVPITEEDIISRAAHPKVIAIGETGLDYFRLTGDLTWQKNRFRTHIRAAIATGKPLIIHTREAAEDTLQIMREERAEKIGGVMHCFTESWEVAEQAMELGFYISMSGIVTFKNAVTLKEVAQKLPLDRLLIETDSPYLAPVPFRGKTNEPAFVKHVAEEVARLKGMTPEEIGEITARNFCKLFGLSTL